MDHLYKTAKLCLYLVLVFKGIQLYRIQSFSALLTFYPSEPKTQMYVGIEIYFILKHNCYQTGLLTAFTIGGVRYI